jgi:hypothetical protein
LARVVVSGLPHHITQRESVGSRRSYVMRITRATWNWWDSGAALTMSR